MEYKSFIKLKFTISIIAIEGFEKAVISSNSLNLFEIFVTISSLKALSNFSVFSTKSVTSCLNDMYSKIVQSSFKIGVITLSTK
jgi:hypothetical protein